MNEIKQRTREHESQHTNADGFLAIATMQLVENVEQKLRRAHYSSLGLRREGIFTPPRPLSEESIFHGTVRMEEHPYLKEMLANVAEAGYDVQLNVSTPYVSIRKVTVVDEDGSEVVTFEKSLHLVPGMRYLDLEHELGHIDQIEQRLSADPNFCTSAYREVNGERRPDKRSPGLMTSWQDAITECHNRLIEFIRLYERQVDEETLIEHLVHLEKHYIAYCRKGIRCGHSKKQLQWRNQFFPEIPDLVREVDQIIVDAGLRKYLRGRTERYSV